MNAYSPTNPRERLAMGAFAAVLSLSLMASVLVLFSDRGLPWSPHLAKSPHTEPACAAGSGGPARCPTQVARATAQAPAQGVPQAEQPKAFAIAAATGR